VAEAAWGAFDVAAAIASVKRCDDCAAAGELEDADADESAESCPRERI
jgi:hypothetical protein